MMKKGSRDAGRYPDSKYLNQHKQLATGAPLRQDDFKNLDPCDMTKGQKMPNGIHKSGTSTGYKGMGGTISHKTTPA